MEQESFKYYAFISYSHADKKIAKKLQKRLQGYHLPSALMKAHPKLPKNLNPVFMDESDLVAVGTLKTALQANLDRSNYLILICSPKSAKSEYVNDEVEYFIKKGKVDHIIPLIVDGVPHSKDEATECFPPAILNLPRENELLGIDLKKFGAYEAFIRIIATLLRLDIDDFIARDRKERRRRTFTLASILTALVIVVILLIPPSYDEHYADNVMENALGAYVNAGHQYENLHALTECAINKPSEFGQQLYKYKHKISFAGISSQNSIQYLADMMKTGKVMPWSREPMSRQECEELLTLADNREEDYKLFASVLEFVMTDDYAKRHYASSYPELLLELLEVDANIAAELYQIVCAPHVTGKYADDSPTAHGFTQLFSSVPGQNEHLTGEDVKQSKESLASLKGARNNSLHRINSSGAIQAYKLSVPNIVAVSEDVRAKKEKQQDPEARMLNDLLAYIYLREKVYSYLQWMLDSFERFDRKRNWETLQLARATASTAKRNIAALKFPELEMTADDYKSLMERKIDVNFLDKIDLVFDSQRTADINTCVAFISRVMWSVFSVDNWGFCMRDIEVTRKIIDCNMQYLANTADWILTSLNNPAATEKFNKLLEKNCPQTHAHQRRQPEALKDIERSTNEVLRQIENLALEKAKFIGAEENSLNLMKDAIEMQNLEPIGEKLMNISNLPALIHSPKWVYNSEIYYFWKDNDDFTLIKAPSHLTRLTRIPDTCMIKTNNVTLDEVKAYQKELQDNGLKCTETKEEGGKFTIYYILKESTFSIIWENKNVTILMTKNPVCFIPFLYLKLLH